MNVLLFCENKYALDILYPIYKEACKTGNKVIWYIHSTKISDFDWKDEVKWTSSMQDCYDYNPSVIYVPGNIVPYYLPGVKIQVFHGYAAEKKDHWIIRRYFDLYLTQGPYFTEHFNRLALKYGDFEVKETGWTKQDWIKSHIHDFDEERNFLLKENNCNEIILYAPTFSPKLTSLPTIKSALKDMINKRKRTLLIIKLHPLTKVEWVKEYQDFALNNNRIKFIDDNNVTKYQLISDIMISDTSSTVYEFLLLNKPVITLKTIAKDIYWTNITNPQLLSEAIEKALVDKDAIEKRKWIVKNYDPHLDGECCKRMLNEAKKYIARYGIPKKRKLNLWRRYTSIKTFGKIKKIKV